MDKILTIDIGGSKIIVGLADFCVNLLNIEKTVIGGGVSNDIELLDRGIQDALEKYLFVSANKNTVVKKTGLGYLAAL